MVPAAERARVPRLAALAFAGALALASGATAAGAKAAKGAKPDATAPSGTIVAIPPVIASIQRLNGRRAQLEVESELDVPDAKLRLRANQSLPRLQDAYLRSMLAYAAAVPPGVAPDLVRISALLQRAADEVLGRPGARVLLGSTVID